MAPPDSAREWLLRKDAAVRIMAAEMVANATQIELRWREAISRLDSAPSEALAKLVDMEILLQHFVRVEWEDLLESARAGSALLDAELPDDEDAPPRTGS